jgi:hypothetical protein
MPNKTSTTSTKTKAEPKAQAAETPNADDVLSTFGSGRPQMTNVSASP